MAERLLDNHPAPVTVVLLHQPIGCEFFNDSAEETWSRRQVEKKVLFGGVIAIDLGELIFYLRVEVVILEIAGKIIKAPREAAPQGVIDAGPAVCLAILISPLAKVFVGQVLASHAQDRELFRE